MLRVLLVLPLFCLSLPAWALQVPVFADPGALLEAVYAQYERYDATDDYDPDDYFEDEATFSRRLGGLLDEANQKLWDSGSEMGALDFSPFINGQDTGGLSYAIHAFKAKGDRAMADVDIMFEGRVNDTITFHFIDEGADRGWKVDEIMLPNGDSEGTWALSEYLADPFIP